ncbi:drug/metabolite transporter (DMT)-like permease [Kitasatospora herbaricolor]|uniref:EamA family transporter n=1 Tax=Kitasatospora herbaricolor TaxID=68217 RepID=UPI00174D03D0|nr:DMT family transporter [Kitasatospora herbaricolor]MDQ0310096.1 drug/metabolite transporter (DMT)-like permease [Kitasatospora herbaricolor]
MTDGQKAGQTGGLWRGVAPLTGFAALTAAVDVYAGNRLQSLDPLAIAAVSFSLTAVFFLGLDIARKGLAAALRPLSAQRWDVLALNVSTAVTWLSMLYALKYLEPAVVNVVGLAIGPVLTLVFGPLLRRGTTVLRAEAVVSAGICLSIAVLVWGSVTGRSGVGAVDAGDAALGLVLTLVCGLASTGNVIYSKRLSEAGLGPQSVLSVRFFLTIVVTWAAVGLGDQPGLGAVFLPAAVIAVIGVGLPLYLIQVGIKHTEPITASLLCTLSPLFAYLLQLPDRRLTQSTLTLLCILVITLLVGVGTAARGRHDLRVREAAARPAPVPAGAAGRPAGDRAARAALGTDTQGEPS